MAPGSWKSHPGEIITDPAKCSEMWVETRSLSTWGGERKYGPADWDRLWSRDDRLEYDRIGWILDRLEISPEDSVLDIGCGPGRLALPLAGRANRVTALDQSSVAVERLYKEINRQAMTNITGRVDNWMDLIVGLDIQPHDHVLAVYALGTVQPFPFIEKMMQAAKKKVVLVEPAGPRHWQHQEFWNLLRDAPFRPGPDYIIILNLLYGLGIYAETEIGEYSVEKTFEAPDKAVEWLLESTGQSGGRAVRAAEAYLADRLETNGSRCRLIMPQKQVMIRFDVEE